MDRRGRISEYEASAFAHARLGDHIARWIVLEMVLWPGFLFIGGSLLVAWRVREQPVALAALLVALVFSAAVGVRQWGVMLRAVFPPRRGATTLGAGEDEARTED